MYELTDKSFYTINIIINTIKFLLMEEFIK